MKFYIIYAYDFTKNTPQYILDEAVPDTNLFEQTEDDESWEYNYLGEENPHNAHIWNDGHHRKWVTKEPISKEDSFDFLKFSGMCYQDIETMGSLTEYGWLPALSFQGDSMMTYDEYGAINISAYVTPIPEPVRPLLSVVKPDNQIAIWPYTEEEINTIVANRQHNDWQLITAAFKNARGY